jgi:hypothetical protein
MKSLRHFWLIGALSSSFLSILAPAGAQTPTPTVSLEQRVKDLEKRLDALEGVPAIALALKLKAETNQEEVSASATPRSDAPLALVDWNFTFQTDQFNQPQYKITYTLKNKTDKAIKLNQSTIQFKDLLGERVYGIQVDHDLKIPAQKEVTDTGSYPANQFIPEQMRLKGMAKENVKAELIVTKAVFSDGSIYSGEQ